MTRGLSKKIALPRGNRPRATLETNGPTPFAARWVLPSHFRTSGQLNAAAIHDTSATLPTGERDKTMNMFKRSLLVSIAAFAVLPNRGSLARAQDTAPSGEPVVASIDPIALAYDYLVDGRLAQDDPANKKFKTLQAACAAVPAGTAEKPTVIGIAPNVYQLPPAAGSTTSLTINKNYITLLGLTNNRRAVVLADNRGNKMGGDGANGVGSSNGYVVSVNATGFTAKNLTFLNYCNVDYEYPGDPSKNLTKRSGTITQAVALDTTGDKHVYENVAFCSRLDTTFIRCTRSYFKNVFIEGTDDFIGGGQVGVWEDCEIIFPTGSGVCAAGGIAFINCKFSATQGMQFSKGAGRGVALINCVMPVNSPQSPVAWVRGKAPPRPNLGYVTYHTKDAKGNKAVVMDGSVGAPTFTYSRELSDQEVLAFNSWNMLRATPTGVVDAWDPAGARAKYEAAGQGSMVFRMAVTNGAGGGGAAAGRGGAPGRGGVAGAGATGAAAGGGGFGAGGGGFGGGGGGIPNVRTGGAGATIGATVSPSRVADPTITWSTESKLISLSRTTGPNVIVTGKNNSLPEYVPITATAANGFRAVAWVYVEPAYVASPTLAQGPTLSPPAAGKIAVNYAYDLGGREDQSVITWSTCDDASGANPREVAVSRGNLPLKAYTITSGDVGKFIKVGVQPKHNISDPGPAVFAVATSPIAASDLKSSTVSPNFRNFIPTTNPTYVSGLWTLLGNWTSVTGDNLVNGFGVRVASQGAALLYQQDAKCGDMQIELAMSPEKTEGMGFGSPGSGTDGDRIQKSDIFIKYDPRTKNGYSLRFWRTTQSTQKCMYQLYRIVDGVGSPLNDRQVLTGVFKPNTQLVMKIISNRFTVSARNDVDDEVLSLEGTITPNDFGGAGVAWFGTVPRGNSNVYSLFEISYPGAGPAPLPMPQR
jgi:hypothetical protein